MADGRAAKTIKSACRGSQDKGGNTVTAAGSMGESYLADAEKGGGVSSADGKVNNKSAAKSGRLACIKANRVAGTCRGAAPLCCK